MTDEELKELESLRAEKRSREQTQRASAALDKAGVPQDFAALLIGADDDETDKKVQSFCAVYQSRLSSDIKKRLPAQPPVVTAPAPQRAKRGIQRLR